LLASGLGVVMAGAPPAYAEIVAYAAELSGANEVPPVTAAGTGMLEATYDTDSKVLTWTIIYTGLTGEANAAHFHGPAGPDASASPVIPLEGSLTSPVEGMATLTDEQAGYLADGMLYFNIHTAQNPGGELRGQVVTTAP
jgi:hypothetical protein